MSSYSAARSTSDWKASVRSSDFFAERQLLNHPPTLGFQKHSQSLANHHRRMVPNHFGEAETIWPNRSARTFS